MEKPADGEEIAVLTTSMGVIKLRLFADAAPKTVENFKGLINKGYYNGLTFHRIVNDFMLQTGDPKGDGTGGESLWGKAFNDEFNANLVNIRGSVSMANAGKIPMEANSLLINAEIPKRLTGQLSSRLMMFISSRLMHLFNNMAVGGQI